MNKSIKKIISLSLCGILLLTGCKERTDTDFGAGFDEDKSYEPPVSETTVSVTETPVTTSPVTTTVSETTTVTTTPETTITTTSISPEEIYGGPVYTDENGNVLLVLTDGIDYVDWVGYYHGYYKLTNVSDKPVTELREKLSSFGVFAETKEMMIEYPFGDNCVDIIKWENGSPDLENTVKYFDALAQMDYTFDNTLDPEEYCIISVTFVNGTEITTTAPETTPSETTTAVTTVPAEEQIPYLTTKLPLSDLSYSKFMPDDDFIREATEIAVRDKEVIIAIYGDGEYKAMTADEEDDLFMVRFLYDFMFLESYKTQAELKKEHPEQYTDNEMYQMFPDAYTSYEAFVSAVLGYMDEEYRPYFDDKGNPLINIDSYLAVEFTFEGSDGKVESSEVIETAIRWVFSLRAQENGLEDIINKTIEDGGLYNQSLTVKCTYKGGSVANATADYQTINTDYSRYVSFVY